MYLRFVNVGLFPHHNRHHGDLDPLVHFADAPKLGILEGLHHSALQPRLRVHSLRHGHDLVVVAHLSYCSHFELRKS